MSKGKEVEPVLCTEDFIDVMEGAEKYYDVYVTMDREEIVWQLMNKITCQFLWVDDKEHLAGLCQFLMFRDESDLIE